MSDSVKKYYESIEDRAAKRPVKKFTKSLMMILNEASLAGVLRETLHKYSQVRELTDKISDEAIMEIALAEVKAQKVCD